jgi:hypothetical protein
LPESEKTVVVVGVHEHKPAGAESAADPLARRLDVLKRIFDRRKELYEDCADGSEAPLNPECVIYSDDDIRELADTLRVSSAAIMEHRVPLEYAASQYKNRWTAADRPETIQVKRRLTDLRDACRGLLACDLDVRAASRKILDLLDIDLPEAAEDGPGEGAALLAGALEVVIASKSLRHAIWRIAWLHEAGEITPGIRRAIALMAAAAEHAMAFQVAPSQREIDAAAGVGGLAGAASADPHVRLAVRGTLKRHSSDLAQQAFAAELLRIYTNITGRPPRWTYSDSAQLRVSGKCLDFLQRAMRPLGVTITPYQFEELVYLGRSRSKRNK